MRRVVLASRALLLAIVGVSALASAEDRQEHGDKIQLKLNLAKGDRKSISAAADTQVRWQLNGQPVDLQIKALLECEIEVTDHDATGGYTVQATEKRVSCSIKGGSVDTAVDSKEPAELAKSQSQYQYATALIGQPIQVTLDSLGQPQLVPEMDKIIAAMKAKTPPVAPEVTRQHISAIRDGLKLTMARLPDKPLAIGDSWTERRKIDQLEIEATCRLRDCRDGVAIVDVDGTMKLALGDLQGPVHGQLQIDQATGWLEKGTVDLNLANGEILKLNGTITIAGK
jgi:hypothetical protein